MREIGERYLRKIYYNLKTCALWLFMAGLTGVGVGAFSSAFSFCLKKVPPLSHSYTISSIRSNSLYFAVRSPLQGAPVLICPQLKATAISAIMVSSVSPER